MDVHFSPAILNLQRVLKEVVLTLTSDSTLKTMKN